MIRLQEKKGITLIALIVTVIILLVLSAVSISMVSGDGLFTKAKSAAERYQESALAEGEKLAEYENLIEGNGYIVPTDDDAEKDFPATAEGVEAGERVKTPSNWKTEVVSEYRDASGEVTVKRTSLSSVYAVSDGQNSTIPIPEGFYYVGGTKDSGVVISDNPDDKDNYKGQANVPSGAIYDTTTGIVKSTLTAEEKNVAIQGNQFVWIPCTYSEYSYQKYNSFNNQTQTSSNLANCNWDTTTNAAEETQVEKYGGFYIGRFEAGVGNIALSSNVNFAGDNDTVAHDVWTTWVNSNFSIRNYTYTGSISSKAGDIPYYHCDYYTANALARTLKNTDYVKTGLVTGTQWDAMIKFIEKKGNTDVTNTPWGNYNTATSGVTYTAGNGRYAPIDSSNGNMNSGFVVADGNYHYGIRTTGSTDGTRKQNLYDVAGNLWEWTQEAVFGVDTNTRFVLRGGSFRYTPSSYPACFRNSDYAIGTCTAYGFRPVLYIK